MVGKSKILIYREKLIKREGEVGRERQQMHEEIMIQDQRAKAAVTWPIMGRVKSGFTIMTMLIKTKEIIMWQFHVGGFLSLWCLFMALKNFAKVAFNELVKMT